MDRRNAFTGASRSAAPPSTSRPDTLPTPTTLTSAAALRGDEPRRCAYGTMCTSAMNSANPLSRPVAYSSPNARVRRTRPRPRAPGPAAAATGGASAATAHATSSTTVAAASTRYACRQPSRSISTSATGGPTSVPAPIPLTAMPIASDRRRPNQPPTAATIGTYAHAVPTPHAQPVRQAPQPERRRHRRQRQAQAHRRRPDQHHPARSHPVGHRATHRPEAEEAERGHREQHRRQPLARVELPGHRLEERAEAVDRAEHGEHGRERGAHDEPRLPPLLHPSTAEADRLTAAASVRRRPARTPPRPRPAAGRRPPAGSGPRPRASDGRDPPRPARGGAGSAPSRR